MNIRLGAGAKQYQPKYRIILTLGVPPICATGQLNFELCDGQTGSKMDSIMFASRGQ